MGFIQLDVFAERKYAFMFFLKDEAVLLEVKCPQKVYCTRDKCKNKKLV